MDRMISYSTRQAPTDFMPDILPDEQVDVVKSIDPIFKYIYGTDPVTGHPIGDLSVYLGDDANPEIRNFIERQLMQLRNDVHSDTSMPTEVVNKFRTLSDDDVARFSRNHDETRDEYADRLRAYFAEERVRRFKEAKDKKLKSELDDLKRQYTK